MSENGRSFMEDHVPPFYLGENGRGPRMLDPDLREVNRDLIKAAKALNESYNRVAELREEDDVEGALEEEKKMVEIASSGKISPVP